MQYLDSLSSAGYVVQVFNATQTSLENPETAF